MSSDVAGERLREAVDLVDERRKEEGAERGQPSEREQHRDRGRRPAALHAVALEPVDRWVERQREEDRDQDPREDVPRDPDDLEQERDRDRDPEHRKDRRGPEPDKALLHVKEDHGRVGRLGDRGPSGRRGSNPRDWVGNPGLYH